MKSYRFTAKLRGGMKLQATFKAYGKGVANDMTKAVLDPLRFLLEDEVTLVEEKRITKFGADPVDDKLFSSPFD